MIEVKFDNNMVKTLFQMIGEQFESYKCGADPTQLSRCYGNILFTLKDSSVELTNYQRAFPFFDTVEDIACFSCSIKGKHEKFIPYCDEGIVEKIVNEKIKCVKIVNDTIRVENENYEISIDIALILECENNTYMFTKDIWFSEVIEINKNKDIDTTFPINTQVEHWNNDGEYKVTVERTIREI